MTLLNADRYLYSTIINDPVLNGLVGTRVYIDLAPQGTSYPFIVLTHVSGVNVTNVTADRIMDSELWQVTIWGNSPSYSTLETIADRLIQVLHRSSGTGVLGAIYQGSLRTQETKSEVIYKAIVLEFRLFIQ